MIGRGQAPRFLYDDKRYQWGKVNERGDLDVSDVVLWHSSYDMTKPLQLICNEITIAEVIFSDHSVIDEEGVYGFLNFKQPPEDTIRYFCLVFAAICFMKETKDEEQKQRPGINYTWDKSALALAATVLACLYFSY